MGKLIDFHGTSKNSRRFVSRSSVDVADSAFQDKFISLPHEIVQEAINIARGTFAPLTGFLKKNDFVSVLENMRLVSGILWPIPIVLDIGQEKKEKLLMGDTVLLKNSFGNVIGILENIEVFKNPKTKFAKSIFGTLDINHPGVAHIFDMQDYLVGGDVSIFDGTILNFPQYNLDPFQVREEFSKRNWEKVVAFQTRNVPHRAHEYLQSRALEGVDGLFIHPVVGKKKAGDFQDESIIGGYEILIDKYHPKDRVLLGILPIKMRYAGPREAVLHAIVRQNFGCSHFIVGRDHAGVGDYYGPYAAQEIFEEFDKSDLEIDILKFPEVVFNKKRQDLCFINECKKTDISNFSGTKLRTYIERQEKPPEYLLRPEVSEFLLRKTSPTIRENILKDYGFVVWFTGLSQSGKSTIANRVFEKLKLNGKLVERLDGDVVRNSLTRDLGFSKEDRDENIRRIGFVSKLLSRNGIGVVASFISPYKAQREAVQKMVNNFIEVYVSTPLEVCEERDTKGLYKRARDGKIPNFTGISAPYERPESPDIIINNAELSIEEAANRVLDYIYKNIFKS